MYFLFFSPDSSAEHSVIRVQNSRLIDSGGGFLIDEQDLQREQDKEVCSIHLFALIQVLYLKNYQFFRW